MTDAQELPEPRPQGGGRCGFAVPGVLAALLLLAASWGWTAQRGKAEAETALEAAVAERDAAVQTVEQSKGELGKAQAEASAGEARITELEQQVAALDGLLAGANAELARLRTAPATRAAPAAEAAAAASATAEKVEEATSQAQPAIASVEPAAAAPVVAPAAASPPKPQTLTITFDVNSSYLPDDLNGRLRALAGKLEPDHSYQVRLVGAVGSGDVSGRPADEARRYNRWLAERRIERVADYLRRTARAADLTIERRFAANDSSRQVQVQVTPVVD